MAKSPAKKEAGADGYLRLLFAKRLREFARETNDFKEFCKLIGMSSANVYFHMRAKGNPTMLTVSKVAKRLKMTDVEFLELNVDTFTLTELEPDLSVADWNTPMPSVVKRRAAAKKGAR